MNGGLWRAGNRTLDNQLPLFFSEIGSSRASTQVPRNERGRSCALLEVGLPRWQPRSLECTVGSPLWRNNDYLLTPVLGIPSDRCVSALGVMPVPFAPAPFFHNCDAPPLDEANRSVSIPKRCSMVTNRLASGVLF